MWVSFLYLACGVKGLIRNPGDTLHHLQIEFLYRSASVIHFPTGSGQYNLTQLKVRETMHGPGESLIPPVIQALFDANLLD